MSGTITQMGFEGNCSTSRANTHSGYSVQCGSSWLGYWHTLRPLLDDEDANIQMMRMFTCKMTHEYRNLPNTVIISQNRFLELALALTNRAAYTIGNGIGIDKAAYADGKAVSWCLLINCWTNLKASISYSRTYTRIGIGLQRTRTSHAQVDNRLEYPLRFTQLET